MGFLRLQKLKDYPCLCNLSTVRQSYLEDFREMKCKASDMDSYTKFWNEVVCKGVVGFVPMVITRDLLHQ